MEKVKVYLDLDGTVADLYSIKNWLPRLRDEDPTIFLECEPMISEKELFETFPEEVYDIRVLTMTPKGASKRYHENVIAQKEEWLDIYFPNLRKRIYKKYGHNKNVRNSNNAILVDDSAPIRNSWRGEAIDPATLWD